MIIHLRCEHSSCEDAYKERSLSITWHVFVVATIERDVIKDYKMVVLSRMAHGGRTHNTVSCRNASCGTLLEEGTEIAEFDHYYDLQIADTARVMSRWFNLDDGHSSGPLSWLARPIYTAEEFAKVYKENVYTRFKGEVRIIPNIYLSTCSEFADVDIVAYFFRPSRREGKRFNRRESGTSTTRSMS